PRTDGAEDAGRGLVRREHDAEGHAARPRNGPAARRAAADDRGDQRDVDGGSRNGPRQAGLRGHVSGARAHGRSAAMSVTAKTKAKPSGAAEGAGVADRIGVDRLLQMYKQMVAIRLFEERVNDLYT